MRTGNPMPWAMLAALLVAGVAGGCERRPAEPGGGRPSATVASPAATVPSSVGENRPGAPVVAFLGDSLTAGLGLAEEQAFPALVEGELVARGCAMRAVNAGVSGDTSAGGVSRVDWVLSLRPRVLVLELGANDGLRGQPIASIEANLRQIARRAFDAGARVLVAGMRMPPSYGPRYTAAFAEVFPRVARDVDAALIPFLLDGVAGRPELNQADGIHPTAAGQAVIARTVAPYVERLLGCPIRSSG
jgi:acyl-CoA thioesterase I